MAANNAPRRNQGGNNNKGGGGDNKKKGGNNLERRARRNVNVQYQPGINSAYRTIDQNNLDFQNQDLGVQSIYGALPQEFDKLNTQYTNRTANISGDLENAYQRFAGTLNQEGLPASEVAANTGVYGQLGTNFLNHLASNDQRALQWNQSGEREGNLSERYARQNLLQDLSDNQQMQYNRIADIQDMKTPAMRAEMDKLRAERQANQQSKAYADMIAQMTGGYLDGGNKGGGGNPPRRNGGNGGNGGNGPGTVSWANIDNSGAAPVTDNAGPGGGGQPQNNPPRPLERRIRNNVADIRDEINFSGLPEWIRDLYSTYPEGDRWQGLLLANAPAQRRQVFRRTQPFVQGLYEASQT